MAGYVPLYVVEVTKYDDSLLDELTALVRRPVRLLVVTDDESVAPALTARGLSVVAPRTDAGLSRAQLLSLLDVSDVVCAHDSADLDADHVRLAGAATDVRPERPGTADIAVTPPDTLSGTVSGAVRFWRSTPPSADMELLSHAVEISSVSGDEGELAAYLAAWCTGRGVDAFVDAAGNLVATRGQGPARLLLLGHLDTVPYRWPVRWTGEEITGRGCVDAKGSLVAYLETLADLEIPPGVQVRVVGAVQEEITSNGAFHARDHYPADAVIVGEPSGAQALTVGYFGLCKIALTVSEPTAHTAGRGVRTAADRMVDALAAVRDEIGQAAPDALVAILGVEARNRGDVQTGEAVLDVRMPPTADPAALVERVRALVADPVRVEVLRCTPGVTTPRSSPLVRAFSKSFHEMGVSPRYLSKKGSSDMNTLATTWHGVPMVAYGPGDARLDHTPHERLHAAEYRRSKDILRTAIANWMHATR